jgi:hypothetical protein
MDNPDPSGSALWTLHAATLGAVVATSMLAIRQNMMRPCSWMALDRTSQKVDDFLGVDEVHLDISM